MIALYIILGLLGAFIISHFIAIYFIFARFFRRFSLKYIDDVFDKNPNYDEYRKEIYAAKEELINGKYQDIYITSFDGLKLHGYYYDYGFKKIVIMFHGVHSDPFLVFGIHAKNMQEHGYNVLIVDQRTHDKSEGKYITYGKNESKDILSWLDYIKANYDYENVVLYGMSMGATSLAIACPLLDKNFVKAMVIDCGYTSVGELVVHLVSTQKIPSFFFLGGVKFLARNLAKVTFDEFYAPTILAKNQIPTIFVHGTLDSVASTDFLMNNYNMCASKKDLLLVEGARHTLAMIKGGQSAFDSLYKFIEREE